MYNSWAIVEMATGDEANYVISALNGTDFEGRPLNIRIDSKPEKPAGGKRGPREDKAKRSGDPSLDGREENSTGLQVVVRNLPWNVTSEMLRGTFEQVGEVSHFSYGGPHMSADRPHTHDPAVYCQMIYLTLFQCIRSPMLRSSTMLTLVAPRDGARSVSLLSRWPTTQLLASEV